MHLYVRKEIWQIKQEICRIDNIVHNVFVWLYPKSQGMSRISAVHKSLFYLCVHVCLIFPLAKMINAFWTASNIHCSAAEIAKRNDGVAIQEDQTWHMKRPVSIRAVQKPTI